MTCGLLSPLVHTSPAAPMLTRLIVDFYTWIMELCLWLVLLIAAGTGFALAVPMLKSAGANFVNETAGRLVGALVFSGTAFLLLAVFTGPILILIDIRKSLRAIEARGRDSFGDALPLEQREPFL